MGRAVESALFEVLEHHEGEELPVTAVQSLDVGPQPGQFSFPARLVPDVLSASMTIGVELDARPASEGLYADSSWPTGAVGRHAVAAVVRRYLELTGTFRVDPTVFARVWNEFVDYSTRETIPFILTAPLLGFAAEFEVLRIADDVSIERMDPEWRRLRYETSFGVGISEFTTQGWGEWTHVIHCTVDVPKTIGMVANGARDTAQRVVTALRLLEPGAVAIAQSWFEPLIPVFAGARSFALGTVLSSVRLGPRMMWHGQRDDVASIFTALLRAPTMPTVALALRRFDGAYGRIKDEDRLVDYWIGLEALFLPDRQDELSYLGSLRIARFLERDRNARIATFELVRRSYALRSRIVHGGSPVDVHETTVGTEQVLRRALRKMLLSEAAPTELAFRELLLD